MSSEYPISLTEIEHHTKLLLAVFQYYTGYDGNATSLSKNEFLMCMNTELVSFIKNQKDPGILNCMMKKFNMNCDGQLDFSEFLNLIGDLAQACHVQVLSSPISGGTQRP
ncbi:protein S100-A11-like [Heteronotia binoei]|uniref:protein S100-A11-like n=1 Tax=Heteronotia binoei TaxID=13085 RepID=UPI00292DFB9E|nr:protein S100-A11-like [Heteronotia binoei]